MIQTNSKTTSNSKASYTMAPATTATIISDTTSDLESPHKRWAPFFLPYLRTTIQSSLTQDSSPRTIKKRHMTTAHRWETLHLCWIVIAVAVVYFSVICAFTSTCHVRHGTRSYSESAWRLPSACSSSSLPLALTILKLLDTNLTLTCTPTLPYDKRTVDS